MPQCKDCGYEFKGRDIKICENCGSENIKLGSDEFDIEKYKKDMENYSKRNVLLRLILVILMIIIFIIIAVVLPFLF
ncbi:MAG: hypothetical protein ACFFC3_14190 [Candidatus Odinarchaeota archaeon]